MDGPKIDVVVVGTGKANANFLGVSSPPTIRYPITATPDVSGPHGRAWLCDLDNGRRQMNIPGGQDAGLAHWIIEAPWAHPVWHSYSLVLMHLRPIEGMTPALIYRPDATHEIVLHAISPDADRNKLLTNGIVNGHWLSPCNFAGQFIEIEDRYAEEQIRRTVQQICNGELSPDTDHRSAWSRLFGNYMMKG